jgi:hypothetical protein
MKFDPMNAEPMGTLILDGKHKPFHALACPLQPQIKQVKRVDEVRTDCGQKAARTQRSVNHHGCSQDVLLMKAQRLDHCLGQSLSNPSKSFTKLAQLSIAWS